MQVYSLDLPFEQHKQFRAEPMEKPRRIQAPGLLENVERASEQARPLREPAGKSKHNAAPATVASRGTHGYEVPGL
jgi:hypothetical protein